MSTTRRTLIAALALPAAAGGIIAGSGALAADRRPDITLMDLWQRRIKVADAAETASKRVDAAYAAMARPAVPEALFLREGDHALRLANYTRERNDGRRWYPFEAADAERRGWRRKHTTWKDRPVTPEDKLPADAHTVSYVVPWPEAQVRADEIAAAWDAYRAAVDAAEEASGYLAANEEWETLDDDLAALDGAIFDAPAHSIAGLTIKARLAQMDIDEGEDPNERLVAGMVRDILAMGGAA